ncbi:sensor domain-containing diguanylate cyclase [Xanthobacter pseudotagetidis]|uniref:sensor domain-containing diguanylate cyclase n=1 Tax=Xanthobacter pseudotagetidis TaxID=3119911 RepID=UPI0037293EED
MGGGTQGGASGTDGGRTSIRLRILALICLAAVPLSAERILSLLTDRQNQITAAEDTVRDLAHRAALAQQEGLASGKAVLDVVSRQSAILLENPSACSKQLTLLAQEIVGIQGLALALPDGQTVCASTPAAIGMNIADQRWVKAALGSPDMVMSELTVSRLTGRNALYLARADRDAAGEPVAIGVVSIDLQWFSRIAARTALGSGTVVDVIGSDGAVIARYPLGPDIVGRRFPDHPLTQAVAGAEEGVARVAGYDGRDRIFAFMRFEGTNVHVAVGVDADRIVRPIDQKILATAIAHLVALACFLALAWFAAERLIIAPIERLTRAVKAVGREEAETVDDIGVAEFAPLVQAVDQMARRLSERNRELRGLNDRLTALARTDGLTDLPNRRTFDVQFSQDWVAARGNATPLTLVMADVDSFKGFNDTYGHLAGDDALRAVARAFSAVATGSGYFVARYGGEEFVVLLPGAEVEQGITFAEEVRAMVEALGIENRQAANRRLTISLGVASVLPNGSGPDALVASADAALYEAKRRGRNCVVAAGG